MNNLTAIEETKKKGPTSSKKKRDLEKDDVIKLLNARIEDFRVANNTSAKRTKKPEETKQIPPKKTKDIKGMKELLNLGVRNVVKKKPKFELDDFLGLIEDRKQKGMEPIFTISNDFTMGLKIGEGAFASVHKSTHRKTGFTVALKTYEKKSMTHRSQLMAIHREIYILAGMQHPNIMRLFEVIDSPSKCHLVMELCHGKNLY